MQAKREADRLRERQEAERARRLAQAQAEAETHGDEAQRSAAAAANTNNYTNNRTMSEKQKRDLLRKAIVGREFLVSPTFDDQPTPELRAAAADGRFDRPQHMVVTNVTTMNGFRKESYNTSTNHLDPNNGYPRQVTHRVT